MPVYTNYVSWLKDFQRDVEIVTTAQGTVLHLAVQLFYEKVKMRTPIGNPELWQQPNKVRRGYIPGNLRASWENVKIADNHYVVQNLEPYAYRIETGWSTKQAPNGMMRLTAMEWPLLLNQASTVIG